jgi:hypothetical protein
MGFFSKFFSGEPGLADAPAIESDVIPDTPQPPVIDYVMAMMETGKV